MCACTFGASTINTTKFHRKGSNASKNGLGVWGLGVQKIKNKQYLSKVWYLTCNEHHMGGHPRRLLLVPMTFECMRMVLACSCHALEPHSFRHLRIIGADKLLQYRRTAKLRAVPLKPFSRTRVPKPKFPAPGPFKTSRRRV